MPAQKAWAQKFIGPAHGPSAANRERGRGRQEAGDVAATAGVLVAEQSDTRSREGVKEAGTPAPEELEAGSGGAAPGQRRLARSKAVSLTPLRWKRRPPRSKQRESRALERDGKAKVRGHERCGAGTRAGRDVMRAIARLVTRGPGREPRGSAAGGGGGKRGK